MSSDLHPEFRRMIGLDKPEPATTTAPVVVGAGYGNAALRGECERVAAAAEGTRNHTLNRAAFSLAQLVHNGALTEAQARDALTEAARSTGLDDREIAATIASGFKGATDKPRPAVAPDPWGGHNTPEVTILEDQQDAPASEASSRLVPGGSFIFDHADELPVLWGAGSQCVWAEGESLIVAGPPGVGKTTLTGQVLRARMVGGNVLGLPVRQTGSKVLYLAMDRPRQIRRALARVLSDLDRETLDARLAVWQGPPLADIAKHPETLLGLAQLAGADTVIVDSLKDAAIGLTDDEVGAGYNRARQYCLANGVEVIELHHTVKRGANGARPNTLADLYGSVWLSAGAGSVVLLWGAAGDPIVEWGHLKHPAEEVGPFRVIHDHEAGTSAVWEPTDLVAIARKQGSLGVSAKDAARAMFSDGKPTPAQVEKARRKLDALAKAGALVRQDGDDARQMPTVWRAAA